MTLGTRLIEELSGRGERGMYFDYAGYRKLRRIDSPDGLTAFLADRKMPVPVSTSNVKDVADALRQKQESPAVDFLAWWACDPYCGMLALPLWIAWRILNPNRQTNGKDQ